MPKILTTCFMDDPYTYHWPIAIVIQSKGSVKNSMVEFELIISMSVNEMVCILLLFLWYWWYCVRENFS